MKNVSTKTHNLVYLSNTVSLKIPENHLKTLESLNDLSIVTRYSEDIDGLVRAFKRARVEESISAKRKDY